MMRKIFHFWLYLKNDDGDDDISHKDEEDNDNEGNVGIADNDAVDGDDFDVVDDVEDNNVDDDEVHLHGLHLKLGKDLLCAPSDFLLNSATIVTIVTIVTITIISIICSVHLILPLVHQHHKDQLLRTLQ